MGRDCVPSLAGGSCDEPHLALLVARCRASASTAILLSTRVCLVLQADAWLWRYRVADFEERDAVPSLAGGPVVEFVSRLFPASRRSSSTQKIPPSTQVCLVLQTDAWLWRYGQMPICVVQMAIWKVQMII